MGLPSAENGACCTCMHALRSVLTAQLSLHMQTHHRNRSPSLTRSWMITWHDSPFWIYYKGTGIEAETGTGPSRQRIVPAVLDILEARLEDAQWHMVLARGCGVHKQP